MASGIYIACTADHTYVERRNPKLGLFWCFSQTSAFGAEGDGFQGFNRGVLEDLKKFRANGAHVHAMPEYGSLPHGA